MPARKRKVSPQSQKSILREASKYLDVAVELAAKALKHVNSAELTDATIAPQFQEAFDKLIEIPPILNGYVMGMYIEKAEHRRQRKLRGKLRRRGVSLQ